MAVMGYPEVSFEYYSSNNSGIGLGLALALDDPEILSTRFIGTPFYRLYFGSKKASGFFIEGFGLITLSESQDSYGIYTSYNRSLETNTNFGFGASLGYKLLTKGGLTGNLTLGIGRLYQNGGAQGYPRLEIAVGKRF